MKMGGGGWKSQFILFMVTGRVYLIQAKERGGGVSVYQLDHEVIMRQNVN